MYQWFHQQVATEGIRRGHKFFAVLGLRWFGIEVEIIPGGGGGAPWLPAEPAYIKITVRYKDREWVTVREQSYLAGLSLVAVKAYYKGIETIKTTVSAMLERINTVVSTIKVRAKKK